MGNRTYETVDGVQTQYTYDDNDRLTQQGGTVYTYDNNGNTKTETLDGNTTTYSYNAKNKLTSVEKAGATTSYTYNHNGIRTSKTEEGNTTQYLIDENRDYAQVLMELDENDQIQVQYTYGHDLISQERNNTNSYYHYDGLGSTRALSNNAGALTDTYNYEAFGEVLNQTGSTENSYLFTGEQFDSSLDQYYLRARYYDQNAGRFTQQDTWMGRSHDPITLNKYLYANADPVMYTDPTGNFSLGSLNVATSINAILTTISIADTAYSLFQITTGEEEVSASQLGLSILLSRIPGSSLAKKIAAKYKAKTGRNLKIPCVKNSFISGTLIHTARGLVPIEDIAIGDYVLSYNEKTKEKEYQEVVHLIRHDNDYELVKVDLSIGESFISTQDHPFYIGTGWVKAGNLSLADKLTLRDGYSPIIGLSSLDLRTSVYNFTVANTHNYYIGNTGTLVHNDDNCVISVRNMDDFFDLPFGASIKNISRRTGRQYDGAEIFNASKKSGNIKKNDFYYLDKMHKDHLEVFNSNGDFRHVINLDGTINHDKTVKAAGRSIKRIIR